MKRLFLWLWFITGACFLVSVFLLNHILDGIYTPCRIASSPSRCVVRCTPCAVAWPIGRRPAA
jgi:hypothetical protein